jgi:TatD DNase family protein
MNWIDSHTHLYVKEFEADFDEVLERAKMSGVNRLLLPNIDLPSFEIMMQKCQAHPDLLHPMIGLHPCDVKEDFMKVLEILESKYTPGVFCAVGETGIDLHWDRSTFEIQKESFLVQIDWAKKWNLPLVIHSRESTGEIIELLLPHLDGNIKGVFHCFSGTAEHAQQIMDMKNFKFGIGGSITYKNNPVQSFLSQIPLEYIILETDSPYLPPTPHRGKRNESAYLPIIGDHVATIYQMPIEEIARITTLNSKTLFNLSA